MYQKALIFSDFETASKILGEINPKSIKTLGRSVRNFVESVWVSLRESVVLDALRFKFGQNLELRQALLRTGELQLIKANPFDAVWGIAEPKPALPIDSLKKSQRILRGAIPRTRS